MKRILAVALTLTVTGILLLGTFNDRAAYAQEELKIGAVGPLTGPGAAWGNGLRGGAEIACDDVNAAGGLEVGGKKYKVRVIAYDGKYTAEGNVAAVTRLATEDKVKFIIGPISSSGMMALHPLVAKFNVLMIGDSYTVKGLNPTTKNIFRTVPTPVEFAMPMAKWLNTTYPEIKGVVICGPTDETGHDTVRANKKGFEATKIKILATELYPRGVSDMAPLVTKILRLKPDIIDLDGSAPDDCGRIIKTAREYGYQGKIIKIGGPAVTTIINVAGKRAEGFLYYTVCDLGASDLAPMIAKYKAKIPGVINETLPFFYDSTNWLFAAMKKAGSVDDVEAVRQGLIKTDPFVGILGKFRWSGVEIYGINQQALAPTFVGQVVDGKPTIIAKIGVE